MIILPGSKVYVPYKMRCCNPACEEIIEGKILLEDIWDRMATQCLSCGAYTDVIRADFTGVDDPVIGI